MDKEIIKDFVDESKSIIDESQTLLEEIEGNYSRVADLELYGNGIDRIMGGARTLAMQVSQGEGLLMVSDYAGICKTVGYKASQIVNNESFFNICVGLLLDATEVLSELMGKLDQPIETIRKEVPPEFIERVRWVMNQFSSEFRSTVGAKAVVGQQKSLAQNEIDDIMKKFSNS